MPIDSPLWPKVLGQTRVKRLLVAALQTRRIPHAYLFSGSEGVGKDAVALELARVLNCQRGGVEACGECSSCRRVASLQHPDIQLIVPLPVGKGEFLRDYSEQCRSWLCGFLHLSSLEGAKTPE